MGKRKHLGGDTKAKNGYDLDQVARLNGLARYGV